jgi:hypothetical protein
MSLAPESFSLSPLVSILPSVGSLTRLEGLVSSIFARYESVEALRDASDDPELLERYGLELAMLRQILDWLAVKPEESGDE